MPAALLLIIALTWCAQGWGAQLTLLADAHVNSAVPAVNSGTISNLDVGGGYTAFLQFDLSTLPQGTTAAKIQSAILRLYVNRVTTGGLVNVAPVMASWGEYSVTYATRPVTGAAAAVLSVSQGDAYVTVDVTSMVQGWVANPATNFGVALSAGTAAVQFDSKENDLTSHPAMLEVDLADAGPAGAMGAPGAPGAPGAQGAPGAPGPAGPAGPAGATGPMGPAGSGGAGSLSYKGTYAAATIYAVGDLVVFGGSSYTSLIAGNRGNSPPATPAAWGVVAQGGANGIGVAGPPGATGALGPAGPQGPQGPQGVPGLGYTGIYSSASNYGMSDVVEYQGSAYISLQPSNHGNTPGVSPSAWGLLAQAGIGVVGPQGMPGLVYQGTYASALNYALGDVVLWQGASWVSLAAANHGNTPSLSPAWWGVLTAQGPSGPAGPPGAAGAPGSQGLPGSVGPNGPIGPAGPQGIAGQAGAQGIPGATGATGLQGPMGPQGAAGPVGLSFRGLYSSGTNYGLADGVSYNGTGYVSLAASNHGNTPDTSPAAWALFAAAGAPGAIGPAGPAGATGATGITGPQGSAGPTGAPGTTGAQGPPVANYLGAYQSSANYASHDAVSWQSSTWVSLLGGNRGNTPDQSPSWWALLAGQGPAGPAGTAGAPGPAGAAGATGPAGATGTTGPPVTFDGQWLVGTAYRVGDAVAYGGSAYVALQANAGRQPDVSPQYWGLLAASGAPGAAGPAGTPGAQGPQGLAGPAGAVGATGATGPPGATGAQGPPVNFVGAYASAANYGVGDTVSWQGSSWISIVPGNRGNVPDQSPRQWALLAAQGSAGTAGPVGPPGATGTTGPAGPGGATGATGAAGAPGINFRGPWTSGTGYAANDAVTLAGSTYLAQAGNMNARPDLYPQAWAVLASAGGAGPTGAAGASATLAVGTVTTGAAGSQASVTNSGTVSAAVLNFVIPQGATGAPGTGGGGGGGGGTSGVPFASMYHAVSYNTTYYSVNNSNASASEAASILTWVPTACAATTLTVFSQQGNTVLVTLRSGTPGSMTNTPLSCSVGTGNSCTATGSAPIAAGNFLDVSITGANGLPAGVWTAVACQ